MSNEIVPFVNGSEARGSRLMENIPLFHRLGLRGRGNIELSSYLTGVNHHMANFIPPQMGHKYVKEFNPSPTSIRRLLGEMKEPSVLWLQGCDQMLSPQNHFPFEKFKTLTALEISSVSNLTSLPIKAISEMTQLQTLNLSHLPIQQFPVLDLLSNLTDIRNLILKDCPKIDSLSKFPKLPALESLHLSYLLIKTLPDDFFSNIGKLRNLVLRGCSKLRSLPSIEPLESLELLDLSHCVTLPKLELHFHVNLRVLDLSHTTLDCTYGGIFYSAPTNITHVFFREAKGRVINTLGRRGVINALGRQDYLQVVDASGIRNLDLIYMLGYIRSLIALDVSRTSLKTIDFISGLTFLKILLLRECRELVKLPAMKELTELEILDISGSESLRDLPEDLFELVNLKELNLCGCTSLREFREGVIDHMTHLKKLDLTNTKFKRLSFFSKLERRTHLIFSREEDKDEEKDEEDEYEDEEDGDVEEDEDDDEEEDEDEDDDDEDNDDKEEEEEEEEDDEDEEEEKGSFDWEGNPRKRHEGINESKKSNELHLISTFTSSDSAFHRFKNNFQYLEKFIIEIQKNIKATSTTNQAFVSADVKTNNNKYFEGMVADLKYILFKLDLLESSDDHEGHISDLVRHLIDAGYKLSAHDFPLDSRNFKELHCSVAKLKLLVPHARPKQQQVSYSNKPLRKWIKKDDDYDDSDMNTNTQENQNLSNSYDSLTATQRYCLLYFAVFPPPSKFISRMRIEHKTLFHLWYGEGIIDEGPGILKVLQENFIKADNWDLRYSDMYRNVHSFVRKKAKAERFFVFNNKGKLIPHLPRSQRAFLLKSPSDFQSSCQLWANYCTNSSQKLEGFKNIRTLFNIDDNILDIRPELFSKMTNLTVLHLGRWDRKNNKPIEVMDLNFFKELKNMKELRLLSLEGVAAIKKLPDSCFSKLINLKMLNLRECSDLEELPESIGSLKSLTHLDLTDCRLLSMLPKGIQLLSKLEVLKGLVITYDDDARQHDKACTLRNLFKLEKLRKLSVVVNVDKFPSREDVEVFKEMKTLCDLKITWVRNIYIDQESFQFLPNKPSTSRCQELRFWEKQQKNETDEPSMRSNRHWDNLNKLVLWCYPSENAPEWLNPTELPNLEKFYILGGKLKTLKSTDINDQNTWNVKDLRFDYVSNMDTHPQVLRQIFPNLTSINKVRLT